MLKPLLYLRSLIAVALLSVILTGCAALGVPTPETFKQNLAVSVLANTSVRETATTLLVAQKITSADAENILKQTDLARDGLNIARSLALTDLTTAESRLKAITIGLQEIQKYLALKQGASK